MVEFYVANFYYCESDIQLQWLLDHDFRPIFKRLDRYDMNKVVYKFKASQELLDCLNDFNVHYDLNCVYHKSCYAEW